MTVFVGAHQHRLPFALAAAMPAFGKRGRCIEVKHPGKDALDFQLGELVGQELGATDRIVSKDSGFDSLIEDLRARGLAVERLREPIKGQGERCHLAEPAALSATTP